MSGHSPTALLLQEGNIYTQGIQHPLSTSVDLPVAAASRQRPENQEVHFHPVSLA